MDPLVRPRALCRRSICRAHILLRRPASANEQPSLTHRPPRRPPRRFTVKRVCASVRTAEIAARYWHSCTHQRRALAGPAPQVSVDQLNCTATHGLIAQFLGPLHCRQRCRRLGRLDRRIRRRRRIDRQHRGAAATPVAATTSTPRSFVHESCDGNHRAGGHLRHDESTGPPPSPCRHADRLYQVAADACILTTCPGFANEVACACAFHTGNLTSIPSGHIAGTCDVTSCYTRTITGAQWTSLASSTPDDVTSTNHVARPRPPSDAKHAHWTSAASFPGIVWTLTHLRSISRIPPSVIWSPVARWRARTHRDTLVVYEPYLLDEPYRGVLLYSAPGTPRNLVSADLPLAHIQLVSKYTHERAAALDEALVCLLASRCHFAQVRLFQAIARGNATPNTLRVGQALRKLRTQRITLFVSADAPTRASLWCRYSPTGK